MIYFVFGVNTMVKKLNNVWHLLFILTLAFLGCIIFYFSNFSNNIKSQIFADGENQYFSVTQYSQYDSETQQGTPLTTISHGDVAYV